MGTILEEYRKVYKMLEDEESREIYLNKLNFLISEDYSYIRKIVTKYLPTLKIPSYGRTIEDLRAALPERRKIVIYGAGVVGKDLLPYFVHDPRFLGFCSHTEKKQRDGYLGCSCISPEELLRRKDLTVIIGTTFSYDEIMQVLADGDYPDDLIFDVIGIEPYYIEAPGQYFDPDFMTYGDNEVLIDDGCLNLNSAIKFREYCGHVKRVYAFEPDSGSYLRCQEKKKRLEFSQVELFPFGTWSHKTTLHFTANGNGMSRVLDGGDVSISVMPIDEVIDPTDRVTMIKMDIEGSELESLRGAKTVIQRDKPKLAICIYHKPEDMTNIPLYIKELVPEYKLYVRHYSNGANETVLYAVLP